jgi:hypothetical protein
MIENTRPITLGVGEVASSNLVVPTIYFQMSPFGDAFFVKAENWARNELLRRDSRRTRSTFTFPAACFWSSRNIVTIWDTTTGCT